MLIAAAGSVVVDDRWPVAWAVSATGNPSCPAGRTPPCRQLPRRDPVPARDVRHARRRPINRLRTFLQSSRPIHRDIAAEWTRRTSPREDRAPSCRLLTRRASRSPTVLRGRRLLAPRENAGPGRNHGGSHRDEGADDPARYRPPSSRPNLGRLEQTSAFSIDPPRRMARLGLAVCPDLTVPHGSGESGGFPRYRFSSFSKLISLVGAARAGGTVNRNWLTNGYPERRKRDAVCRSSARHSRPVNGQVLHSRNISD